MNGSVLSAFRGMQPRPVDAWMFSHEAVRQQIEMQIANFPAMALPNLIKPTVICGVVHAHGVGEMWMITGTGFERSAPIVLEQQQALCASMYNALQLHRMHMIIDSDRKDAKLWAERVGFVFEKGPMKRMGPRGNDQDFYLWERS